MNAVCGWQAADGITLQYEMKHMRRAPTGSEPVHQWKEDEGRVRGPTVFICTISIIYLFDCYFFHFALLASSFKEVWSKACMFFRSNLFFYI